MSITFTNARRISTGATTVPWGGQVQASYACLLRFETGCGTGAAQLNTNYFLSRGLAPYYTYTQANGTTSSLNCRFYVATAAAQANKQATFNLGTTYHVAVVFDQGQQTFYANGIGSQFGTLVGPTKTGSSSPVDFGANVVAGTPFVVTLHDFSMWNGYALTPADVAGLRDGSLLPPDVGGSASWRGRWTMEGTSGSSVMLGDPGIANAYGDTAFDLKTFVGPGSSIYSAPLVFEPAAMAIPKVMTSGKTIGFTFAAISNGAATTPLQAISTPTVKVNGTPRGSLSNPWLTGTQPIMLYAMPPGVSASPTDTVTVSAPNGWMNTPVGVAGAMVDLAATNCTGRSAYGVDTLTKTFRGGTNNAHLVFQDGTPCLVAKNWRLRCDTFGASTYDATGRPTSSTSFTTVSGQFYKLGQQGGIDKTVPLPVGYWAVGWDDTNPSQPTTLSLTTTSPLIVSIVEHPEYNNPGTLTGGVQVGVVRVFQVSLLSTVVGTSPNDAAYLRLQVQNASKTFSYTNDVVYGPGDFTLGTPTVLDRSDPYALSAAYLEWLANGVGSLRWIDSLFGFGGSGSNSQPEDVFRLTDYTYGLWGGKTNQDAFFTQARPWNSAVTPYVYGTLFGSEYPCTLASPIDAVATTLSISDASTAPVIIGLRLHAGSELMRVLDISGTSVTVERGSCGTTPASHAAGTVQVQYRFDVTSAITGGQVYELVSATHHRVDTGQTNKAFGAWPTFTFTNGSHPPSGTSIVNYQFGCYVTGQTTVLHVLSGSPPPVVTLDGVYTLDPSCKLNGKFPETPGVPIEFAAKTAAHFTDCALHFSLPHPCTDSLAWAGWGWVRDNLPADRVVWFEYSNEPWNFIFVEYGMLGTLSKWLYPGGNGNEWYVRRCTELVAIGRQIWTAAGRDPTLIRGLVNNQKGAASLAAWELEFAYSLGKPLAGVCIADYCHMDETTPTQVAFWQYDDEQAIDLCIADLRTAPDGYTGVFAAMNSVIAAYNAAHGQAAKLCLYEGGASLASPLLSTTLSGAIDAVTTSIPVAAAAGFSVPGTPIQCETEWMTIVSVAGNVLTVARGAYGSTAATHASGKTVRTAALERSHDLMYNPNWYFYDQELMAMEQAANLGEGNRYSLAMGGAEPNTYYGMYHIANQHPGYGDNRDGKGDNRLVLACPGKAHTKAATLNQDMNVVSVRGQAYLDWMGSMIPILTGKFRPVSTPFRRKA